MRSSSHSGVKGNCFSRQRRPVVVARFLNNIPIEDRRVATNALLRLGLRAYEKIHSATPTNVQTLRSTVLMELLDNDPKPTEAVGENTEHEKPIENHPEKDSDISVLQHTTSNAKVLQIHSKASEETPLSAPPHAAGTQASESVAAAAPCTLLKAVAGTRSDQLNMITLSRTKEVPPRPSSCDESSARSVVRSVDVGRSSLAQRVERHVHRYAPALNVVTEAALRNLFSCNMESCCTVQRDNVNTCGTSPSSPLENSEPACPDSFVCCCNRCSMRHSGETKYLNVSAISSGGDEALYPVEFLRHLISHIRTTRGRRQNPLLIAASMPQPLAVYTLQSSFPSLYKSLLVSFHVSDM
uniref:Uncharacterized protein TCIL3000_10_8380 n=1 Tax=Trypanosoma congolense (strain IL3000) TaxID=1068625 RepID=G0UXE5_TRYCI|nr:unnamed protein product [Trypanosoma congolense IL3000]